MRNFTAVSNMAIDILANGPITTSDLGFDYRYDGIWEIVDADDTGIYFLWKEFTNFHSEKLGEHAETIFSETGLTDFGKNYLINWLSDWLAKSWEIIDIKNVAYWGSATYQIILRIKWEDIGTESKFDDFFDKHLWPLIAGLINVHDPGTFGSPYIFDKAYRQAVNNKV